MAKEKPVLSHLERLLGEAIGNDRDIGHHDDPARERWPKLWEWLTTLYVGPNREYVKQPASLRITMGPEGVLVNLSDPDLVTTLDTGCANLGDVLDHLENVLAGPAPPFRQFGKRQPTLRKRKTIT